MRVEVQGMCVHRVEHRVGIDLPPYAQKRGPPRWSWMRSTKRGTTSQGHRAIPNVK